MNSKSERGKSERPGSRLTLVSDGGDPTDAHGAQTPADAPDPGTVTEGGTPDGASPEGSKARPDRNEGPSTDETRVESDDARGAADDAYDVLADVDPAAYYRMLTGLVRSTHSSVLGPLPYSPSLRYHNPTCVVVEPDPTSIGTAELYARAAYPDFDEVLLGAFSDPARADLLTSLYHLLVGENQNVAMVTNHGQIIDIALVLAAMFSAMLQPDATFGVLDKQTSLEELAERSNVLVSRMVTTRQAFSIPAIQVLENITRVFLTVPQTASRRRAKLDTSLIKANNVLMREKLAERLESGGQLLAMAASGSQDLTLPNLVHKAQAAWRQRRGEDPGEVPTLHLQPLYDGTIDLMMSCRYVLPVAICLEPASPACVIGGLTRLDEPEDCHRVMDWIATAHQEATGTQTIYHWHEDDLLAQVRALMAR